MKWLVGYQEISVNHSFFCSGLSTVHWTGGFGIKGIWPGHWQIQLSINLRGKQTSLFQRASFRSLERKITPCLQIQVKTQAAQALRWRRTAVNNKEIYYMAHRSMMEMEHSDWILSGSYFAVWTNRSTAQMERSRYALFCFELITRGGRPRVLKCRCFFDFVFVFCVFFCQRPTFDWFVASWHVLCWLRHCVMADSIVGLVCFQ